MAAPFSLRLRAIALALRVGLAFTNVHELLYFLSNGVLIVSKTL